MVDKAVAAKRVRRVLEILAEFGRHGTDRSTCVSRVLEEFPLSDVELEVTPGSVHGQPRGVVNLMWGTTDLTKAGWMTKSGSGHWAVTDAGMEALADHPDAVDLASTARGIYNSWHKQQKIAQLAALASALVPIDAGQEAVLAAAQRYIDEALTAGASVFAPQRTIWTPENSAEISRRFIGATSKPGKSFLEQLDEQLQGASDDVKLLMAELIALQLLPVSTDAIGSLKKHERINHVLDTMAQPVTIPSEVSQAFEHGSFNPGQAMNTRLFHAVEILAGFAVEWIKADSEKQQELLADPWAFRDFVRAVPGDRFVSQRQSLLYLFHPETFASIVSEDHLRRIVARFAGEVSSLSGDLDRDMLAITIALQVKNKGPVNYYESPLFEQWAPGNDESGSGVSLDPAESVDLPSHAERELFPAANGALANDLFMPEEWLQSTLDLIERRRQVIFYGPPGTGKTFLAQRLAKHIGHGENWRTIQFHPSYSYEDFVAGYRPVSVSGNLTFELKQGPLLRISESARRNPDLNYVLVIDEINRGNLAKIFGELYFLLEYRDERIELLYGDEGFALPANLFILGTMNTADRSIALLDAAMRRRFAFVELHPDKSPTREVLSLWLDRHGLPQTAVQLLEAFNARIQDESLRIGPSYLMPKDHDLGDDRLAQIWEHELLPLVAEITYGDGSDVAKTFGLPALRKQILSTTAAGSLDQEVDDARD